MRISTLTQQAAMRDKKFDQIEALRGSLAQDIAHWTTGVEQFVTAIPELTFYRREAPTPPASCVVEPSVGLVVQGTKRMTLGEEAYVYGGRRFLITSLDLPVTVQVVEATPQKPYLCLALRIDLRLMADLMIQSPLSPREQAVGRGMILGDTTPSLLDAFKRLLMLLDEPDAIPALAPLICREIHFRLLTSNQGARLRQIASMGSQSHRIARAIEWLKTHYAQPLRIEELAAQVQMGASAFHHHFREMTAMSPLQFQKWLRLHEARRLMIAAHCDAAAVAFHVGYESPSQFSREYSRLFGAPPKRDVEEIRSQSPRATIKRQTSS